MDQLVEAGVLNQEAKLQIFANKAEMQDYGAEDIARLPRCQKIIDEHTVCNAHLQIEPCCDDAYFTCLSCHTDRCIKCGGQASRNCKHLGLPPERW